MPHKPVSSTSRITQINSPCSVNSKTEKLKIRTSVVWKHITRNCVVTCEKRISTPVTPETRQRSKIPSLRSISMAPDVSATDKKKIILVKREISLFSPAPKLLCSSSDVGGSRQTFAKQKQIIPYHRCKQHWLVSTA